MNRVILGGGGNLGQALILQWHQDHTVRCFSHRHHDHIPVPHRYADYNDMDQVLEQYQDLIKDLDVIDDLIVNVTPPSFVNDNLCRYPDKLHMDQLRDHWLYYITAGVIVPHVICLQTLPKMTENSQIVFIVSAMSLRFDREDYTSLADYAGIKGIQGHLMTAFQNHNANGVTCFAISPHLGDDFESVKNSVVSIIDQRQKTNGGRLLILP